jgi:outer membrane protein TolC
MTSRKHVIAVFAALLLLVPLPSAAQSAGADAETDTTVVAQLVEEALASNLGLKQEQIALEQARAALAQARGQYLPRLDVSARYSRAEGGRTIDFPVGDLLNPVYRTLNQQASGSPFPEVDNQEIRFLREREQETSLQLRQPVFAPEIVYGTRARRHQRQARQAAVAAFRREVVRDVKVAYFRYRQAQSRVEVLEAARELARENRRTSARLVDAAKTTRDAVYRAEVDVLAVEQQLEGATAAVAQARRYLNVLRNRPPRTPVPAPQQRADALIDRHVRSARASLPRALSLQTSLEAGSLSTASDESAPTASDESAAWTPRRAELDRLDAAVHAAEAQRRGAQTAYLPSVSLAVDAGIQGERYGFDGEKPFVMGSVVLRWNLFDGFQDRREVQRRRLEAQKLRTRRADVAQQITLELQSALDEVRVAARSLQTAEARVTAAQESFRLTSRRHDAGRANQVELTDARTALTEAKLNLTRTRYDLLIRLAELEYAAGDPPGHGSWDMGHESSSPRRGGPNDQ